MKLFSLAFSSLGIATLLLLSSCADTEAPATVQVRMIDAPADYEAVNIEVVDVQVNVGEDEDGWQSLDEANPGIYNLLELTNGASALLGEVVLPSGQLSQVRLVLGDNNTLVEDGRTVALNTPSAQQSGLKIQVNATLEAGASYQLVLDFDAARSIVPRGNSGNYNLKPVIRGAMDALTGGIGATLIPATVSATVYALVGSDTITSTYSDDTGAFLLGQLDEGTYTVVIDPGADSGYKTLTATDIPVQVGVVSNMGELTLLEQ